MGTRAMGERGFQTILLYRALQMADPTRPPGEGAAAVSEALASNVRERRPWAMYMEILHRLLAATRLGLATELERVTRDADLSAESKMIRIARVLRSAVLDGVDALRDGRSAIGGPDDPGLLGYDTTLVQAIRHILKSLQSAGEIQAHMDCEAASFILYAMIIAALFEDLHGVDEDWADGEHRLRVLIGIVFRYWRPRALRSTG